MQAILLIDHGSRREQANALLSAMAELVAARRPDFFVTYAHMELAPPTLAEAVAACIEAGADDIVVVPFFLAPGRHATEDIPRMVEEQVQAHPEVRLRMTECLGAHPLLAELVVERVELAQ